MRNRASFALLIGLMFLGGNEPATTAPLGDGKMRYFGSVYNPSHTQGHIDLWNQVTPENAGKWGAVEANRDVMNWTNLDEAYNLAKNNGNPFRFHVLIWGKQQPNWIESLSSSEQRAEIEEWFAAVATRYPDIDYLEVVNEPLHDPPSGPGNGNYLDALGGAGASGWEWVLESYRLARTYFPGTQLMINDFGIIGSTTNTNQYLNIITLLQAEDLIDIIGFQAHSFSTTGATATMESNLNSLATTGLPIQVTELDIDGPTDALQLSEYQRILPIFWEHPAVMGITLWGYRPGMWRTTQMAYLINADGSERPAMGWLRNYLSNNESPLGYPAYTSSQGLIASARNTDGDPDGDALSTGIEYFLGTNTSVANPSPITWLNGGNSADLTLVVSPLVAEGNLIVQSSPDLTLGGWSDDATYDWTTGTATGLTFTESNTSISLPFDTDISTLAAVNGTVAHSILVGGGSAQVINREAFDNNAARYPMQSNPTFRTEFEDAVLNDGELSFDVTILANDYDPSDAPNFFRVLVSPNTQTDGFGTTVVVNPGFDFSILQTDESQTIAVTIPLSAFDGDYDNLTTSSYGNIHFGTNVQAGLIGNGTGTNSNVTYYIDNLTVNASVGVPEQIHFSRTIPSNESHRFFRLGFELP